MGDKSVVQMKRHQH